MIKLVWSRSAIMYTFTYQHQPGTRISCFLVIGAGDMTVSLIIFKMNVLLFYKYKYRLIQEFSEEPNADNIHKEVISELRKFISRLSNDL